MKKIMRIIFLVLIVVISGSNILFAQDESEIAVKTTLNKLFDLSKSKSFEKAASYIAYEGEDKNRVGKESFYAANKDELNQAKRKCKEIAALIELSDNYTVGKFSMTKSENKELYIVEINFISGTQKLVKSYSFIKTEKGLLLTDMN
jgi:hypothetical protein